GRTKGAGDEPRAEHDIHPSERDQLIRIADLEPGDDHVSTRGSNGPGAPGRLLTHQLHMWSRKHLASPYCEMNRRQFSSRRVRRRDELVRTLRWPASKDG